MTAGVSELKWPVLARTDIVGRLVDGVIRKPARSAMLRGASGIGKTSIAIQAARRLEALGRQATGVVALAELREIPLGALLPALTDDDPDHGLAERAHHLMNRIGAQPERHVLVIDDAPLLDDVSASIVYQLLRVFGVPAILTARDEYAITGPIGRLLHEDLLDSIEVGPLSHEQMVELAESFLHEPLRPESAQALYATTQGNALFLREALVTAQRSGGIVLGPHGAEVRETHLPGHLLDAVRSNFDGLPSASMELAQALALSQPWPEDVTRAWDAEAYGVLQQRSITAIHTTNDTQVVRLAHPFFTEYLLSNLSASDRGRREREAAAALRASGDDALRLTAVHLTLEHHDADAGELEWAAGHAIAAGDKSAALRLAMAARQRGAGFAAALFAAMAASDLDDGDADRLFAEASHAARSDHDVTLLTLRHGQHLAYRRRDPQAAVIAAEDVLSRIPSASSVLGPEVLKWKVMAGDATPDSTPSPHEHDDPLAVVSAGIGAAMFATMAGNSAMALEAITAARPHVAAVATAIPHASSLLDLSEFLTHVADGRVADAGAFAQTKRIEGPADAAGMWSYTLGLIAVHGGRCEDAARMGQLSVRQLQWRDFTGLVGPAVALCAMADALCGEPEKSRQGLASLDEQALLDVKTALHVAECQALLAWATPDFDGAIAALTGTVATAVAQQHFVLAALAGATALRLGAASATAAALEPATVASPSALVHTVHRAASATAQKRWADAAATLPALREAGLVSAALSVAHLVARHSRETMVRRRAQLVASELAASHSRDAVIGDSDPYALSAREREVAAAAAQRLRNKEIADKFDISSRTVENHLANIYRKLGISGRDEIAGVLNLDRD